LEAILTRHSKLRYNERVNSSKTLDEIVELARRYGLSIADIPKCYKCERRFLKYNKIYYNGYIFVFAPKSAYTKLVTVYPSKFSSFEKIFLKKENDRKKKEALIQKFILFNNNYYKITYYKNKIIEFRLLSNVLLDIKLSNDFILDKLKRYLNGEDVYFKKYIAFKNISSVDKMIYDAVINIPYGKTISYTQLANKLDNKFSISKLVYTLNKNPLLILIPTHRVICNNGRIGSFCSLVSLKEELLKIEHNGLMKPILEEYERFNKNDFTYNIGNLFKEELNN